MAAPPAILLEPEDNEAFHAMLRKLTQLKRRLSLQTGKPGTPLEEMHAAKVISDLIGNSPTQAKMALAAAQAKVTREELLQGIIELEKAAFDTVTAFEGFATKSDQNSEESVDCLLYTSPSPRDKRQSRMPSSA